MRLPPRLHRNRHGVFGFRAVIPQRLRGTRSRREFRITLGIKDPAIARVFAQHLGGILQRRLAFAPRMNDDDRNREIFALIHDIASEREKVWAEMLRLAYYGAETDEQGELLEDPLTKAIETHLWLQEMQSKPVETLDDLSVRSIVPLVFTERWNHQLVKASAQIVTPSVKCHTLVSHFATNANADKHRPFEASKG